MGIFSEILLQKRKNYSYVTPDIKLRHASYLFPREKTRFEEFFERILSLNTRQCWEVPLAKWTMERLLDCSQDFFSSLHFESVWFCFTVHVWWSWMERNWWWMQGEWCKKLQMYERMFVCWKWRQARPLVRCQYLSLLSLHRPSFARFPPTWMVGCVRQSILSPSQNPKQATNKVQVLFIFISGSSSTLPEKELHEFVII